MRTSLNKSVCLIKDTFTNNLPFDTKIINHQTYDPSLSAWTIDKEKEKGFKFIKK